MRSIGFGMAKLLLLAAAAIAQEHSTIYVGSNKGLFRTTDGGNTSEILYALDAREILAVAAGADDVLFAAATDGLFRSADSGKSWASTNLPLAVRPRVIVFDPERPEHVYAGGNGLWRSCDGGVEWVEVPGFAAPVTDVVITPLTQRWCLLRPPLGSTGRPIAALIGILSPTHRRSTGWLWPPLCRSALLPPGNKFF